jgi:hypothetical protein
MNVSRKQHIVNLAINPEMAQSQKVNKFMTKKLEKFKILRSDREPQISKREVKLLEIIPFHTQQF